MCLETSSKAKERNSACIMEENAVEIQVAEPADDWVWMADHSNQIGPEKALVVLGVRAARLPAHDCTRRSDPFL